MYTMYPEAELPLVQLSMRHDYDPAEHLRVGRLLTPLRDQGVVIIGSGFSYHNTRTMRDGTAGAASAAFDAWLGETLTKVSPEERSARLLDWTCAPAARLAHPQEDHLTPLMVAVGAAEGEAGHPVYFEPAFMGSVTSSSYRFGDPVDADADAAKAVRLPEPV